MAKPFDPKAKARRQKILAGVLGVVLLGVMAYQAPTILGLFGGGSSEVATEPAPPPSAATAVPAASSAPPAAPATGSAELVDSDVAPQPAQGQLVTFDRFESKDPFVQQGGESSGGTQQSAPEQPPKETGPREDISEPSPRASSAPATPARTATISVNGVSSQVAVAASFPEGDPIFKLVALTRTSARVGIVDGTYATGSQTITLKKGGKPVTLMNTADGTTYVLRLVALG